MLFVIGLGFLLGAAYAAVSLYERYAVAADETLSTTEIAEEVGEGDLAAAGVDTAEGSDDTGAPLPPKQGQSLSLPPVQGTPITPMDIVERRAFIARVRDAYPNVKDGLGAWADDLVRLGLRKTKADVWDEIASYVWEDKAQTKVTGWAMSMASYPNVRRVWEKLLTVHGYSESRHAYYYPLLIDRTALTVAQDKAYALWPSVWSTKPL